MEDLNNMQKLDLAIEGIRRVEYGKDRTLQEAISEEYDAEIPEGAVKALEVLDMLVKVADPGQNVNTLSLTSKDGEDDGMRVYEVIRKAQRTDGDVYMGCELNQKKAELVWGMGKDDYADDESGNIVVEIPGQNWYDRFEALGWKRLSEINLRDLSKYKDDVSERTYNEVLEQMGIADFGANTEAMEEAQTRAEPTPPEQEDIHISMSTKRTQQDDFVAKTIKDRFTDGEPVEIKGRKKKKYGLKTYKDYTYEVDTIILSPNNAKRNISDYYWLAGEHDSERTVALGNCNVGTYEYLKGTPGIYHIDKLAEMGWEMPLQSSAGTATISDNRENIVLHIVQNSKAKDALIEVADEVPRVLESFYEDDVADWFSTKTWEGPDYDTMVYAPVTQTEMFELLPAVRESGVPVIYSGLLDPDMVDNDQLINIKKSVWLYAKPKMDDWDPDSTIMKKVLSTGFFNLTNGGKEMVDALADRHSQAEAPTPAT